MTRVVIRDSGIIECFDEDGNCVDCLSTNVVQLLCERMVDMGIDPEQVGVISSGQFGPKVGFFDGSGGVWGVVCDATMEDFTPEVKEELRLNPPSIRSYSDSPMAPSPLSLMDLAESRERLSEQLELVDSAIASAIGR